MDRRNVRLLNSASAERILDSKRIRATRRTDFRRCGASSVPGESGIEGLGSADGNCTFGTFC
jgi:hypothetical protein